MKLILVFLLIGIVCLACTPQPPMSPSVESSPVALIKTPNILMPTVVITPRENPPLLLTPTRTPTKANTLDPDFLHMKETSAASQAKIYATDVYFYGFCGDDLFPDQDGLGRSHPIEITVDWVMMRCRTEDWSERYQKFIYKKGEKIWTISLNDKDLLFLKDKYDIR